MYNIEWYVQHWMICTTLNMYNIEWYVQHWMICTTLNDLYYFAYVCNSLSGIYTSLNDLNYVQWFEFVKWFARS